MLLPGRTEAVGRLERDLGIVFLSVNCPCNQTIGLSLNIHVKLPAGACFLPVQSAVHNLFLVCCTYFFYSTVLDLLVADSALELDLYLSDVDLTDSVPY